MRYELSNHLGNVLVTISDKKLKHATEDHYYPDVITFTDYYAFGMAMPNRTGYIGLDGSGDPEAKFATGGENHRYAFNGKEADRSEWNTGTVYDYGFRVYDPRLGKFLSVDPLCSSYPWFSPYQFAGNIPTWAVDIDGLEPDKSPNNNEGVIEDAPDKKTGNDETWQSDGKTWNKCEGTQIIGQGGWHNRDNPREVNNFKEFAFYYANYYAKAYEDAKIRYRETAFCGKVGGYNEKLLDQWASEASYRFAAGKIRMHYANWEDAPIQMPDGTIHWIPRTLNEGLVDANWIVDGIVSIPFAFRGLLVKSAVSSSLTLACRGGSGWFNVFGDDLVKKAMQVVTEEGFFDIVVHGTKGGGSFVVNGTAKTANAIVAQVMQKGMWDGKSAIRLISCHANEGQLAQKVANLMKVPVKVPTFGEVTIGEAGELILEKGAEWIILMPK